jgi:hypothetical protein
VNIEHVEYSIEKEEKKKESKANRFFQGFFMNYFFVKENNSHDEL